MVNYKSKSVFISPDMANSLFLNNKLADQAIINWYLTVIHFFYRLLYIFELIYLIQYK